MLLVHNILNWSKHINLRCSPYCGDENEHKNMHYMHIFDLWVFFVLLLLFIALKVKRSDRTKG